MTLEEVIKKFNNGNRLCKALGIHRQNFTYWRKIGFIPIMAQRKIEMLTEGELKASFDDLPNQKQILNKDKF